MSPKTTFPFVFSLCVAALLAACTAPVGADGDAFSGSSQPRAGRHYTPAPGPGDLYGPVRGSVP
jgi:hypothetical protein